MKNVFITLSILALAGCSTMVEQATEYKVTTQIKEKSFTSESCKDKTLRVRDVFASDSLMSDDMKYIIDTDKELAYTQSKWAISPDKILTAEILKSVRASGIFASVHNSKSRIYTNLSLESDVEEFMQYFDKDTKNSISKVVITFTLVDNRTKKILGTKRISKEIKTDTLNAAGGVKALNKAFSEVLDENNIWLDEVCK